VRAKIEISMMIILLALGCSSTKRNTANLKNQAKNSQSEDNSIKILDEHVGAMAKLLGKDQKTYRMHIRTDVDGAKIYRQIGRYVIVDSNGDVIYVPDRF